MKHIVLWTRGPRESALDQTKLTILIQFQNSFISGVLTIALPLLMKEREIDIVTIGLIFACLPIIFQLSRMLFAIVSDFLGRKLFFVLNGFLNILSSLVYYLAYNPLQFLLGKVTEGTKSASLWAVNRAFLLEESGRKRKALVNLRACAYVSMAVGSFLSGVLIVWFSYMNTLLFCILVGLTVVPTSLLLAERKKKRSFSLTKARSYLDLRNKDRVFTIFLLLFVVMGLSFGFVDGYVFTLFLEENKFDAEAIGVFLGIQMLLAGLSSYLFAKKMRIEKLVLLSGSFYSLFLLLLGFSTQFLAASLIIVFGVVTGLIVGGQEEILLKVSREESYGTDIGLLMMGLHAGTTTSLAISGFLIARWGFAAPFLTSALIFPIFYSSAYLLLKPQRLEKPKPYAET